MFIMIGFILFIISGCAQTQSLSQSESVQIEAKQEAELHFRLGNGFYLKKDFARALTEYSKSVELDPQFSPARNNLALTYYSLKKPVEAKNQLIKALELNPKYMEAHNNLARVYLELEQLNQAETELSYVLSDLTFTDQDKALSYMGLLKFKQNKFKEALTHFQKSLRLNKESCFSYVYFARTLSALKDAQASAAFDKSIQVCGEGQNEEALFYSALHFQSVGDSLRARARLEDLIQLYPYGEYNGRSKTLLKKIE